MIRTAIRTRHYSLRTEEAYVHWIKRFILFHGKRHPFAVLLEPNGHGGAAARDGSVRHRSWMTCHSGGVEPMAERKRQIIVLGGGGFSMEPDNPTLDLYILSQARTSRPAVSFVGTASGDADAYLVKLYTAFSRYDWRPSHLPFFHRTPALRDHLLRQDVSRQLSLPFLLLTQGTRNEIIF